MSHCNQCGLDWTPRVDRPRACPGCKRYDWNEQRKKLTADRSKRPVTLQTQSREDGRVLRAKRTPSIGDGDASAVLRNEGDSQGRPKVVLPELEEFDPEAIDDPEPVHPCRACEEPIVEKNGKWYCNNVACSLNGMEQKPRKVS